MSATEPHIEKKNGESGQAMTETVIASAFLLVPLFLGITLLGKYIDVKENSIEAARYAAFESTVYNVGSSTLRGANVASITPEELQNGVATRFFGQSPNDISASQDQTTADFVPKNLLTDHAGNHLLPKYSDITTGISDNAPSVTADPEDPALEVSLGALAGLTGFNWDYKGLIQATVQAKTIAPAAIRDKSWSASGNGAFDQLQLPFSSTDVILTDTESAPSPQENSSYVHNQIGSLVPLSKISAVNKPLQILKFGAPDLSGLNIGQILTDSPDEVPYDRLANNEYGKYGPPAIGTTAAQLANQIKTLKQEMEQEGDQYTGETTNNGTITLTFKGSNGSSIPVTIQGAGSTSTGTSVPPGNQTQSFTSTDEPNVLAPKVAASLTSPPKGQEAWTQTTPVSLLPKSDPPPANWAYIKPNAKTPSNYGITSTFTQKQKYACNSKGSDCSYTTETMVVTIVPEFNSSGKFIESKVTTTTSGKAG